MSKRDTVGTKQPGISDLIGEPSCTQSYDWCAGMHFDRLKHKASTESGTNRRDKLIGKILKVGILFGVRSFLTGYW